MSLDTRPRTEHKQQYVEEGVVAVFLAAVVFATLSLMVEGLIIEGVAYLVHRQDIGLGSGTLYATAADFGLAIIGLGCYYKEIH